MQLSDILEENSVSAISQKTKISENNLENLLASKFENLKKVKTLGFISIIEREYNADLSALSEEANEYYGQLSNDRSITLGLPIIEEKKGRSKFMLFVIFFLFGYATWYFFTQFDKKHLSELIPFIDEQMIEKISGNSAEVSEVFIKEITSEEKVVAEVEVVQNEVASPAKIKAEETTSVEKVVTETAEAVEKKEILILPFSRLWFGLIDMETKDREHFSIDSPYKLDVTENIWLIATSSAPFSLLDGEETKDFNDAKEHYFKIDKNGIEFLTKSEYVALGGWSQW